MRTFTRAQVAAKKNDCWVIIHGSVYNLKPFLKDHPGGAKVILKEAGGDGTKAFDAIHPIDIIDRVLPKELYIGSLDPKELKLSTTSNEQVDSSIKKPPLGAMLNLFDFEAVAKASLSEEAFAYYSSGADDELTLQENHSAFHRIWLRPRVLINVKNVNTSTVLLECKSRLPVCNL
jgi:L-lactate dehydrogenase (cytochrome)